MNGASREALAAARERLDALLGSTSADPVRLGGDLASVTVLLDGEAALRRVLTDPARPGDAKAQLVENLLGGQIDETAIDLVSGMVRSRWSGGRDLADSLEELSSVAELTAAERDGGLDTVEDELFRFGRIVSANPELRAALTNQAAGPDARGQLVGSLLDGRAHAVTERLVARLVRTPRGRSLEAGLESYSKLAAELRERIVAVVTAALPLTEAQKTRLGDALTRIYGRRVHLNIDVDQRVVGGLRIEVGDEVIDGTVAGRLEAARQHLGG